MHFVIGLLSQLTHLNVGDNNLIGTIPTIIINLSQLSFLTLSGNLMNGSIPSDLGIFLKLNS